MAISIRNSEWSCSDKCGNGDENCNRVGNAVTDDRKRKSKQHLFMNESDYRLRLQEGLYTSEHILAKIFRKDGPPLGVEFDTLPSNAFLCAGRSHHEANQCSRKRRKVSPQYSILDHQTCLESISPSQRHGIGKGPMVASSSKHGRGKGLMSKKGAPGKRHGIGKGLMTVWQATNLDARNFSYGTYFGDNTIQKSKIRVQRRQTIQRKLANKAKSKKKTCPRNRKVECHEVGKQKKPPKEICELALDVKCLENTEQFANLVDDEELELRESRTSSNPLSCSAHFLTSETRGCSLCKDSFAKFPPYSVTMKLPLFTQPWASSPDLVKKLMKAFQFICTYAATVGIHPFTFDEFVQAFHEKDSLLLGQVHLTLVRLLLSDINKELTRGFFSLANKNCRFLGLLLSLEHHGSVLEFWQKSLNLLTWTEILRQVFIAAGFGSKSIMTPKKAYSEEVNLMEKYGLSPCTLKGELFKILFIHGNTGMHVSDLAKASSIVEMNLTDTLQDRENLITSTLSCDITLFEKISSCGYRLRIHGVENESEVCQSDSDDFGSIDDIAEVTDGGNVDKISEDEFRSSRAFEPLIDAGESKSNILTVHNEIDESHQAEEWLMGLMEGEYSDLSTGEKLNILTILIDLLSAGSNINIEDPMVSGAECPPNNCHYGSGAKIKRSMRKHCNSIGLLGRCSGQTFSRLNENISEQPVDSLVLMSKIVEEKKHANMKEIAEQMKSENYLHPMQSIFLGSDRRYNRYWLFLGPCHEFDPGHRRIYFESSEDGHWEIIDTRKALCSLLSSLDPRGAREAHLRASLEKREAILTSGMLNGGSSQLCQSDQSELNTLREDSLSPVSDVDNRLGSMQTDLPSNGEAVVEYGKKVEQAEKCGRSRAFDASIWKSFYFELNTVKGGNKSRLDSLKRCDQCQDLYWREEKHCRICHTTFELNFDLEERYAVHSAVCRANMEAHKFLKRRNLSSQLQSLKAATYAIESVIPDDALVVSWRKYAHNLWVNRLRRATSLTEFLQVLADFVTAINEDWFYQNTVLCSHTVLDKIFSNFSSMPETYSAVGLWLVKLDTLVASCEIL